MQPRRRLAALMLVNGRGGTGSMTIQGAPVQIIDVNNTLYLKGSDAFWSKVGGGSVTDATKGGTIYVATSGKPYPVEIAKAGSGGGTVRFTEYGQTVSLAVPANAIDIAQRQG